MPRPLLNPAQVDWSGENPCIYLKETDDGEFVTLATFFRVVWSPHGRGHACFLLEAPNAEDQSANICLTDNEPLARWLASDFVQHFGAFRQAVGLRSARYLPLDRVSPSLEGRRSYTERCHGAGLEVSISWEHLGDAIMVELPREKSATSKHEMFSVVVDAQAATVLVNGRQARGKPVPRDFFGHQSTTAFLAFSETWVRVA